MQVQQERDRVPARHLLWVTLAALGATAAFVVLAAVILDAELGEQDSVVRARSNQAAVNQLELTLIERTAPGGELDKAKEKRLNSYGWLNADAGVLHIPIEVATKWYLRQQSVRDAGRPAAEDETTPGASLPTAADGGGR